MTATFIITDNDSREQLIAALRELRLDPVRPWRFRLLPFEEPVTDAQRGYYRKAVLPPIADVMGKEDHEAHWFLVNLFAGPAGIAVCDDWRDAREFEIANKVHMREFITRVIRWAATTLNVYVEPPRQ